MVGQIQSATDLYARFQALMARSTVAQPIARADAKPAADSPTPPAENTAPAQVAAASTLTQFERARVTFQAQDSVESDRSYAFSATLTYERIAYSQTSTQPVAAPATDLPAPVAGDDTAQPTQDAAVAATPEVDGATPASGATLHHVVVNATTIWYRQLTSHVVAPVPMSVSAPADPSRPTPATTTGSVDSAIPAAKPAIERLSVDDFATLRARTSDRSQATTLALKLTTQEGDLVELQFRQLDLLTQTRLSGVTDSGDRVRASDTSESHQRYVNMQITGDLSDAEKSAIDAVLQNVVDVANQFFHGDLQAAIARLSDAQIDTSQLADVSLKMSMSQSREMNKVLMGEDGRVQQLAHRDSGVGRALEFLADRQRTLITAAKTQFDARSSVSLVKQLLPTLIAPSDAAADAPPAADATAASAPADATVSA